MISTKCVSNRHDCLLYVLLAHSRPSVTPTQLQSRLCTVVKLLCLYCESLSCYVNQMTVMVAVVSEVGVAEEGVAGQGEVATTVGEVIMI